MSSIASGVKTYVEGTETLAIVVLVEGHALWMGNETYADDPDKSPGVFPKLGGALDAVSKAGPPGSKGELIGAFKSWDPKVVMEELDNLVDLGLITPTEYTVATFVDTASVPVTSHFTATAEGKTAVASPPSQELVVDEP